MQVIDKQIVEAMCGVSAIVNRVLDTYGEDPVTLGKIWDIVEKYNLGYGADSNGTWCTYLWQYCGSDVVGGDVVHYNNDGSVDKVLPLFSEYPQFVEHYFAEDIGLFGGNLVGKNQNIIVVQDVENALLLATKYSDVVVVAVGYGRELSKEKLQLLRGNHVLLCPPNDKRAQWEQMARELHLPYRVANL